MFCPSAEIFDQDANSLSPDQGWDDVQCDYIDQVMECLLSFLQDQGLQLTAEELIAIKADLKSAFMQIPLHLSSIGSVAVEMDGWLFVFGRTPFGWKWATHTWSQFTRAIKMKLNSFNRFQWDPLDLNKDWSRIKTRYLILSRLSPGIKVRAVTLWKAFLAFFNW